MPRRLDAYNEEILSSIEAIKSFIDQFDFNQYCSDLKTKAAVERKLLNIGEALNQASDLDGEIKNTITDFRKIVGFRNFLAHSYFGVDDALVWSIVVTKLDSLKRDLEIAKRERKEIHPWRLCPAGQHWVRTHRLTIPPSRRSPESTVTTRHAHCASNASGKDQLYPEEIREISGRNFSKLKTRPCGINLGFPNGSKYDELIAGWTQYWNEVLRPEDGLSPNLVKALIASESAFDPKQLSARRNANSARGLMQITNATRKILGDERGEIRDQYITATRDELNDPNVNICAGIRWLFHKQETASKTRLKRTATWIEAAQEYKGDLKGLLKGNSKSLKDVAPFLKHLRALEKCEK